MWKVKDSRLDLSPYEVSRKNSTAKTSQLLQAYFFLHTFFSFVNFDVEGATSVLT